MCYFYFLLPIGSVTPTCSTLATTYNLSRGKELCWHFLLVKLDMQGVLLLTFQEQQCLEALKRAPGMLWWLLNMLSVALLLHFVFLPSDAITWVVYTGKGPILLWYGEDGNWLVIVSSTVVPLVKTSIRAFNPFLPTLPSPLSLLSFPPFLHQLGWTM